MIRFWYSMVFAIGLMVAQTPAMAQPLSLDGLYQRPDGAITVLMNGDTVDPYFASKALLVAADVHVDAHTDAQAWIHWLLAYQHPDGRFDRYCIKAGQYARCAAADADDAMMAVWIELLIRFAPAHGMPEVWRDSIDKAHRYLATLRDARTGVYQISATLPVALLMDNVEIYSALRTFADYLARVHDNVGAQHVRADADALSRAIVATFWSPDRGFRASTQVINEGDFYPTKVAQLFPMLSGLTVPGQDTGAMYAKWMRENCKTWLAMAAHDYPWGLVALAAYKSGDMKAVSCWYANSGPYRHGVHWNVLEETLYVTFEQQLRDPLAPVQCCPDKSGGVL